MLAFAFGLRLRSKTQCFKTSVLGRRLPNGVPQKRLRFRDLRSKTLAFKKRIAIVLRFRGFPRGQGLRSGPLCSKNAAFAFAFLSPPSFKRPYASDRRPPFSVGEPQMHPLHWRTHFLKPVWVSPSSIVEVCSNSVLYGAAFFTCGVRPGMACIWDGSQFPGTLALR